MREFAKFYEEATSFRGGSFILLPKSDFLLDILEIFEIMYDWESLREEARAYILQLCGKLEDALDYKFDFIFGDLDDNLDYLLDLVDIFDG